MVVMVIIVRRGKDIIFKKNAATDFCYEQTCYGRQILDTYPWHHNPHNICCPHHVAFHLGVVDIYLGRL